MVLKAIEAHLQDAKVDLLGFRRSCLSNTSCRSSGKRTGRCQTESRKGRYQTGPMHVTRKLHRLGNLTLATVPMNTALSNSAWSTKQKLLNAKTRLLLNVELMTGYPVFDDAIDERTRQLAARVCEIWRGPTRW
jgi:hypothetical protein